MSSNAQQLDPVANEEGDPKITDTPMEDLMSAAKEALES